jgi:hypothetical protein
MKFEFMEHQMECIILNQTDDLSVDIILNFKATTKVSIHAETS